jgi:hypothetical protein
MPVSWLRSRTATITPATTAAAVAEVLASPDSALCKVMAGFCELVGDRIDEVERIEQRCAQRKRCTVFLAMEQSRGVARQLNEAIGAGRALLKSSLNDCRRDIEVPLARHAIRSLAQGAQDRPVQFKLIAGARPGAYPRCRARYRERARCSAEPSRNLRHARICKLVHASRIWARHLRLSSRLPNRWSDTRPNEFAEGPSRSIKRDILGATMDYGGIRWGSPDRRGPLAMGVAMTNAAHIPWKILDTDLGDVPFYVIEFDKHGKCTSPAALEHLLKTSKTKTDIFLFSHGWNNDWIAATNRYDLFINRFTTERQNRWSPPTRNFAPLLVGVFWPSAALVAPWERAPDIASAGADDPDAAAVIDGLDLDPGETQQLLDIVSEPSDDGVERLASLLAPKLTGSEDEVGDSGGASTKEDLLAVWKAAGQRRPAAPTPRRGAFIPRGTDNNGGGPEIAGWNPMEKIRDGLRLTTVLVMKDRAGRVGGRGVAEALHELADASDARISLIGHSYGAKVVLSALTAGSGPSREVDSVLLLQPALSCFAFAANIEGAPGGYRPALDRVRLPIVTTYSGHDEPLTKAFHLAARRKSDIGEAVIAGRRQPPSKFAALGGYGPQGLDADWIDMPAEGVPYPPAGANRIVALDGTPFISSHGAVETPETAWALLSQVRN